MSGWGAWFGGQSAQKRKDAPKKAILDLRQQLDMLQKRERHLENQMAKQDEVARENVTTNKTGRSSNPVNDTFTSSGNETLEDVAWTLLATWAFGGMFADSGLW